MKLALIFKIFLLAIGTASLLPGCSNRTYSEQQCKAVQSAVLNAPITLEGGGTLSLGKAVFLWIESKGWTLLGPISASHEDKIHGPGVLVAVIWKNSRGETERTEWLATSAGDVVPLNDYARQFPLPNLEREKIKAILNRP